jgi:hypothetical protein
VMIVLIWIPFYLQIYLQTNSSRAYATDRITTCGVPRAHFYLSRARRGAITALPMRSPSMPPLSLGRFPGAVRGR